MWFQIMISFQDEMQNLAKSTHFKNSHLFSNDQQKTCDILGQLYVFLIINYKIFHSKILSYEKVKKD